MSAPTLHDDPDPIDRARACDLGDAGLPGHCLCVAINAAGDECFLLAKYSQGEADYDIDWPHIAPHEIVVNGLPIYRKDS